jgi:hypothetical protein
MRDQGKRGNLRGPARWLRPGLCLVIVLAAAAGQAGCTRVFYRKAADENVEEVLTEKDQYPDWAIKHWYVYPHPLARFADPTNPDRPPMPPDDPAAHDLSPNPQKPGHAGIGRVEGTGYLGILTQWDAENRTEAAARAKARGQKPETPEPAPADETERRGASKALEPSPTGLRPFLINLEQCSELGILNSREFQDQRENLYLVALPVTLERYAFAAQFFGVEEAFREWAGRQTPTGKRNNWTFNTTAGFAKLFSTGAILLFSVANQTVFNLSGIGGKETISTSTLTLDLFQPLLRGGGRAVTLEPLTQAERNLLYQIRIFARFRKEFFVAIAGGGGGSITGGAFVPTGVIANNPVSPTTGLGASGLFPGLALPIGPTTINGLNVSPGQSGRLNLSTAIPPTITGYLGTLLQFAQINIDKDNINRLVYFLRLFEATKEGGEISQLQVDQVQQQLLMGESSLYLDQQQYFDALDRLKLQLGVPTDLYLELDNKELRPLIEQFARYEEVFKQFTDANKEALKHGDPDQVVRVRGQLRRLFTSLPIGQGTRFRTEFQPRWASWEKLSAQELTARLKKLAADRTRLLDEKADLEKPERVPTPADRQRLQAIAAEEKRLTFDIDVGNFEQLLRRYEGKPWQNQANPQLRREQQQRLFRTLVDAFMLVLVEARNERLEILHRAWPKVPPVCVEGKDLLQVDLDEAQSIVDQTTLNNRLDLMNVRAQLVDAWRQIAVFANSLLGTFNVEYRLQSFTPLLAAKPLAFGGSRNHNQIFLNGELPLVRRAERNNYRAALIAFQRQRRALMEAEDLAMLSVRGEIRQLRQFAEQYKIQVRQVELAYLTVENSLDTFLAPPALGGGGGDTATRAAALTNQLLMAQRQLPVAQNAVLTVWVNYVNTRFQLYRDLELMPLDYRGVWIDDNAAACDRNGADGCRPVQERSGSPADQRQPQRRADLPVISLVPEPALEHAN